MIKKERFGFDEAIKLIKEGYCVSRESWDGKEMYIYLKDGSTWVDDSIDKSLFINGVSVKYFSSGHENTITIMPHIEIVNAQGCIITGWVASQTDMLAEDWIIKNKF